MTMQRKKNEALPVNQRRLRKSLYRMLFILVCGCLILIGVCYYAFYRISFKPEWYQSASHPAASVPFDSLSEKISLSTKTADRTDNKTPDIKILPAQDVQPQKTEALIPIRPFVETTKPENPKSSMRSLLMANFEKELAIQNEITLSQDQIFPVIKSTLQENGYDPDLFFKAGKATFSQNHAVLEMIVDLQKLPHEKFSKSGERAWLTLLQMTPGSSLSEIYLKMDLYPYKQEQMVRFLAGSQISIGKMNIPIEQVEKKFGLKMQINLKSMMVSNFELKDRQLVLKK